MNTLRHLTVAAVLSSTSATAHALCITLQLAPLINADLCCEVSASSMAFGDYQPITSSNAVTSTANVRVECSGLIALLVPYDVKVTQGTGTYAVRTLRSGSNTLNYNLYTNSAYTQVFGDGTAGTSYLSGGILLNALNLVPPVAHPIYGRIPAGQVTAVPGSYSETLNLTLSFY